MIQYLMMHSLIWILYTSIIKNYPARKAVNTRLIFLCQWEEARDMGSAQNTNSVQPTLHTIDVGRDQNL